MKKIFFSLLMLSILLVTIGGVSAATSADIELLPSGWLKPNVATEYEFSVTGTGTTDIEEVKITKPTGFPTPVICGGAPENWELIENDTYFCKYYTIESSIEEDGTEEFTVTVTNPSYGDYTWQIKLNNAATYNPVTTVKTIQSAIDDWEETDGPLEIPEGTYEEDLVIDKAVTLQGNGEVTIKGNHRIEADDVIVQGFTFDLTTSPSVGFFLTSVSGVTIEDNVFNGPVNKICNPWKIGGSFGSPIGYAVSDFLFEDNEVNKCSIPINLHDQDIDGVVINNNVFRDTEGVVYVWNTEASSGVLSNFVFTNNDVDSSNSYGIGIDTHDVFVDANFGTGNRINNNQFIGIPGAYEFNAVSIASTGISSYELDAENNNWGVTSYNDVLALIDGNVDFDPWLPEDEVDPVITDFSLSTNFAIVGESITITADISEDRDLVSYVLEFGDGENITEEFTGDHDLTDSLSEVYDYDTEGDYVVRLTVTDSSGNTATETAAIVINGETPDWVISLSADAPNLISVPFVPENTDYKEVFDGIKENLDRVWVYVYNEDTKENEWKYMRYNDGWSKSSYFSGDIVPGQGYIVFMNDDDVFYGNKAEVSTSSGSAPTLPPLVKLANGYNLIGVFGNTGGAASDVLGSLYSLDGINPYWYDLLDINGDSIGTDLEPNTGYWVSMKHVPDSATEDYYAYYP